MDFQRMALAAVAAWVVFLGVTTLVSPVLMGDLYARHASLLRATSEQTTTVGFGAALFGFFAFAYAYAKGYEGGAGPAEGSARALPRTAPGPHVDSSPRGDLLPR